MTEKSIDALLRDIRSSLTESRAIETPKDFSGVCEIALERPESFRWSSYGQVFMARSEHRRDKIILALYGPEDANLHIGLCPLTKGFQSFSGEEIGKLYDQILSIYSTCSRPNP